MTYSEIKPHIESGLVSEQSHPENPDIRIFNYTQKCQFSKEWNDVTRACRGLILNVKTGEIVANPFPKFFNYGEVDVKIPAEKPIVIEKMDGSLGILYWLHGDPYIATRGSFVSEQALWATKWFRENCDPDKFNQDYTFLFEIIYPANRSAISTKILNYLNKDGETHNAFRIAGEREKYKSEGIDGIVRQHDPG